MIIKYLDFTFRNSNIFISGLYIKRRNPYSRSIGKLTFSNHFIYKLQFLQIVQ